MKDAVNNPSHYTRGEIEVLEFIEDQGEGVGFCKGSATKYIYRAGFKEPDKKLQDLEKGAFYALRLVEYERAKQENRKPRRPADPAWKSLSSATAASASNKAEPRADTAKTVIRKCKRDTCNEKALSLDNFCAAHSF